MVYNATEELTWINHGDNAWQLTAASLVGMQSVPGLVVLGDPYTANADAAVAVLNTNITTAMSLLTWTACNMFYYKKPSVLGAVQGMITGLVAITPAAGVIDGWAAVVMGILSGSIPWLSMNIMGKKIAYFQKIDDVLGIFHTHCVAGFVGGFCVGLYASLSACRMNSSSLEMMLFMARRRMFLGRARLMSIYWLVIILRSRRRDRGS
jgi:ammonia channel protein AmtB